MMKTCKDCGATKPVTEFPTNGGKILARCRPCKTVYDRNYYSSNKVKVADRRKVTRKAYADVANALIDEHLLANPCITCGEKDIVVLEFDHRDPKTKKYNIAEMVGRHCSLEAIRVEIAKCDVMCANCHRRKTAKQFGYRRFSYPTGATNQDLLDQYGTVQDVLDAFPTVADLKMGVIPSNPTEQWERRNIGM